MHVLNATAQRSNVPSLEPGQKSFPYGTNLVAILSEKCIQIGCVAAGWKPIRKVEVTAIGVRWVSGSRLIACTKTGDIEIVLD